MRLSWITVAAILVSTNVNAGIEQDLLTCSDKTDKLDRLVCFDALADKVRNQPSDKINPVAAVAPVAAPAIAAKAESKPVTPTTLPAVVATTPATPTTLPATLPTTAEDEFGKTYRDEDKALEKLYMEVSSAKKDLRGLLKINFTNGQQWKQIDSGRFKLKTGQTVYIEKGAFGSFVLGLDDRNSTIRVKRIK